MSAMDTSRRHIAAYFLLCQRRELGNEQRKMLHGRISDTLQLSVLRTWCRLADSLSHFNEVQLVTRVV